MRDLAEIGMSHSPETAPSLPSAELIRSFEREFGLALPADYVQFLMKTNGGYPQLSLIRPHFVVDRFLPIVGRGSKLNDVWKTMEDLEWALAPNAVPIGHGGCGGYYVLDLGEEGGPVMFFELHGKDPPEKVANSFGEMIDLLELDPYDEFGDYP